MKMSLERNLCLNTAELELSSGSRFLSFRREAGSPGVRDGTRGGQQGVGWSPVTVAERSLHVCVCP